jgi:DNA/RNA endonuclease YhcR with UshA esterase domain
MAELCRWRAQMLADVEGALSRSSSLREAASVGQGALFDLGTVAKGKPASSQNGAASEGVSCTEHELLANEKEVLGFYLSGHPLARFRKELSSYTTHTLGTLPESGIVRVAGMIVNTKKTVTKTGHAMSRFKLEDLDGELECVVFPKTLTPEIAKVLVAHEMVVVKGRVELRADDKNLLVEEVVPLKEARERFIKKLVSEISTAGLEEEWWERSIGSVWAIRAPAASVLNWTRPPTGVSFGVGTRRGALGQSAPRPAKSRGPRPRRTSGVNQNFLYNRRRRPSGAPFFIDQEDTCEEISCGGGGRWGCGRRDDPRVEEPKISLGRTARAGSDRAAVGGGWGHVSGEVTRRRKRSIPSMWRCLPGPKGRRARR